MTTTKPTIRSAQRSALAAADEVFKMALAAAGFAMAADAFCELLLRPFWHVLKDNM